MLLVRYKSYNTIKTRKVIDMPNRIINHIVSIDDRIYNYLNNVKRGANKLKIHYLTTMLNGLINLS